MGENAISDSCLVLGVQAYQERDLRTPLSLVGELSREGLWFGSASAERSREAAFGGVMSSSRNMMFSACTHKFTKRERG